MNNPDQNAKSDAQSRQVGRPNIEDGVAVGAPIEQKAPKRCTCVYATSRNTGSVRMGYEMGGYVKEFCQFCLDQVAAPAPQGAPSADDCEDQGFSKISDGCPRCVMGFDADRKPIHAEIKANAKGWLACVNCKGSYGPATTNGEPK